MQEMDRFAQLARTDAPTLDLLALAIAGALRDVDQQQALAELDRLAGEVVLNGVGEALLADNPEDQDDTEHGDVEDYDHPDNSMLDLVLERKRGLPILLSVVWVEVGRRVGIPIRGVGLPGHYVAGWFGDGDPILLDPFKGGVLLADPPPAGRIVQTPVHLTALRILSNLVASYERRGDVGRSLKAAQLRLELPLGDRDMKVMEFEHRRLGARMN